MDPLQCPEKCVVKVYVLFEAHAARSTLLSKNRTMPVHAGTQRWILDGAAVSLTFALSCIPTFLKKHAPMYSCRRALADEGHENTEQIAPQGVLSSFFQRCYLHLFACGWTCKSDPRFNQPQPGKHICHVCKSRPMLTVNHNLCYYVYMRGRPSF